VGVIEGVEHGGEVGFAVACVDQYRLQHTAECNEAVETV